jgi:hypothetical protein
MYEKIINCINDAVHQGTRSPIHISGNGPWLTHLFFVDDVLLITTAKNSQLRFITEFFARFSRASCLKINLLKSQAFYSTGTSKTKINKLMFIFGIRSTASLDKYLGILILKGRAKRIDKM